MGTLETGRENAFRFVQHVNEMSRRSRVIVIHADDRHNPWPWMKNPAWQNLVLDQLEHRARVESPRFCEADEIDGLLFTAISTAGDSRIARLPLHESLDGPVPDTWWREPLARVQAAVHPLSCWWCIVLVLALLVGGLVIALGVREREARAQAAEVHSLEVPYAP